MTGRALRVYPRLRVLVPERSHERRPSRRMPSIMGFSHLPLQRLQIQDDHRSGRQPGFHQESFQILGYRRRSVVHGTEYLCSNNIGLRDLTRTLDSEARRSEKPVARFLFPSQFLWLFPVRAEEAIPRLQLLRQHDRLEPCAQGEQQASCRHPLITPQPPLCSIGSAKRPRRISVEGFVEETLPIS